MFEKIDFSKLPDDNIQIIAEYYYSSLHFDKMRSVLDDLKIKACCRICKLTEPFQDNIDNDTRNELMRCGEIISKCKGCERHMTKRPTYLQLCEGFVAPYSTSPYKNYNCKCTCRLLMRFLTRELNDPILY